MQYSFIDWPTPTDDKRRFRECSRCGDVPKDAENQVAVVDDRTSIYHCRPYKQDWWTLYDGTKVTPCRYYDR